MPERPIIVLPEPSVAARSKLGGGPPKTHFPTRARQGDRLNPRFNTLRKQFEERLVSLHVSAAGQMPEEVVVFETVGPLKDFIDSAKLIPGFDFLNEWEVEEIAPDDDFYDPKHKDAALRGRLFLVMSNQQALQQLLALWQSFQRTGKVPTGFRSFAELFTHLHDVRLWSVEDRLHETGVLDYWSDVAMGATTHWLPSRLSFGFAITPRAEQQRLNAYEH
jgi:hypothetical protein